MSDNAGEKQDSRQIALRIDESKMDTTYANTIRTSTTPDEVVRMITGDFRSGLAQA